MQRGELERYLDDLLEVSGAPDYCPNGLQVEGRPDIQRILCGVTASQALLDRAVAEDFDAVMVHHGYFWKGDDPRLTGIRRHRLKTLLAHDINLFAYHLPLDRHAELGNNAQLGKLMDWSAEGRFGEQGLGWIGALAGQCSARALALQIGHSLGREALLVGDADRMLRRVAWCTGAAQGLFEAAIAAGADVFVSGEISEHTVHLARESGVAYVAAGHHATERYGIRALAAHVSQALEIDCRFVDIDNPV